MTEM
ncbi:UNVERIFIED_CONTAM: hypothetical protein GTU68_042943 [Idotea baltica]|jgi:hypothetical protein